MSAPRPRWSGLDLNDTRMVLLTLLNLRVVRVAEACESWAQSQTVCK